MKTFYSKNIRYSPVLITPIVSDDLASQIYIVEQTTNYKSERIYYHHRATTIETLNCILTKTLSTKYRGN